MEWSKYVWPAGTNCRTSFKSRLRAVTTAIVLAAVTTVFPLVADAGAAQTPVTLPTIDQAAKDFHDPNPLVETLFRNGLLSTLKEAARQPDNTVYVGTGDIYAEWLRDSSAQVRPYLYYAKGNAEVSAFLRDVIARQMKYIQIDPYANAFKADYATDPIHERKFELDSLAYPIILAWTYWKETGDDSIFTKDFATSMGIVLDTMETEQDHPNKSKYTHFALTNLGKGNPVGYTGMIWTGFRPSDDNCVYNFLIPSEMMAVVALTDLAEIEDTFYHDDKQTDRARDLRNDVHDGIQKFGIVHDPKYGDVYAYEVDGLGNYKLMDDANIPSLLSAPYLGYVKAHDPIYRNTRRLILSTDNPNFNSGIIGEGIGSQHTPKGTIWPLALIMQGLTATSQEERVKMLDELLASDPGDHVLHESFNPDDPKTFTRKNFGWPNALFVEYILVDFDKRAPLPMPSMSDLAYRKPHSLRHR
jgi:meiotically up-regulated gene 157 (Mug157) protein